MDSLEEMNLRRKISMASLSLIDANPIFNAEDSGCFSTAALIWLDAFYPFCDMTEQLPRLLLGTSPFIGAGQFGWKALEYSRRFFDTPENMTRLFVTSARLGVQAVQLMGYEPVARALRKAEGIAGDFFVAATLPEGDVTEHLNLVSSLEPEVISLHAASCDRLDPKLGEWIDRIKETGARPAASTHNPGTSIPLLESLGFEVFLAPLNPLGYGMKPDFESTLRAVKNTQKPVIAIKPLAAGKLLPDGSVFEFIFQYADSIAVGITSEDEMKETYSAVLETSV